MLEALELIENYEVRFECSEAYLGKRAAQLPNQFEKHVVLEALNPIGRPRPMEHLAAFLDLIVQRAFYGCSAPERHRQVAVNIVGSDIPTTGPLAGQQELPPRGGG